MDPIDFPETNSSFRAPDSLDESQCHTIRGFYGTKNQGALDGVNFVVTAWKPSPEELEQLKQGGAIYLTFLGGLPPHFPTVSFQDATNF